MSRRPPRIVPALAAAFGILFSAAGWAGGTLLAATAGRSAPRLKARILYDIPYTKAVDVKEGRRQGLDLYLPDRMRPKPPLVVFIHGGFWTLTDDDYRIGAALAQALVPSRIAVALVRYRLAPAWRHPAQADDVAAAVAYLAREAGRYGYDGKRIFLVGHSAGAHLAAVVALDPAYLAAHHAAPESLAGVVAISGIYDLHARPETTEEQMAAVRQAFGDDPGSLTAASPLAHVRAGAPPFLILSAASDFPGFLLDARKFAAALRGAGNSRVDQFVIPDRDHFSMMLLTGKSNPVRALLLDFFKVKPLPPELAILAEAKRGWLSPPFSTLPFWEHKALIRSYPIDRRFVERLLPVYQGMEFELLQQPLERYFAIDLFSYLDSLPPEKVGRGDYLVLTNVRDEKEFWIRREVEPYKPVIVIGIDDEKNLFRLGLFYQPLRETTWKGGPQPPLMARPLGAFIYFLEEPPLRFQTQPSHYALTEESFRLVDHDPLAPLRKLPQPVFDALTYRNGCIYCHAFQGIGSRSHHIVASTGAPHGGYALPLEDYPPQVWKAFMFDQVRVAAKIGASPNSVDESARQLLYELVVQSRSKRPAQAR